VRLVFLGSGAFAIPSLEAVIAAGHQVAAVVTQPDRESGRGRGLAPPPVKLAAERLELPVLQPERVRRPEALEALRALAPELSVVVDYGQILPRAVIDVAPRGTVNVHGSLLPRWRGAAPIQWAIASGDSETGVTTMLIDEGLDTGPTLLARAVPIGPRETAAELLPRLALVGGELLVETIAGLADGSLRPTPQDAARATHARLLVKEDGRVDWTLDAHVLDRRARGFQPWPGAFTFHEGRLLKLLRVVEEPALSAAAEPGVVTKLDEGGLLVACGGGTQLRVGEVQPESRRPMSASAWARGARVVPGARLG
jgi:methionyl-tRNA formyltransferase